MISQRLPVSGRSVPLGAVGCRSAVNPHQGGAAPSSRVSVRKNAGPGISPPEPASMWSSSDPTRPLSHQWNVSSLMSLTLHDPSRLPPRVSHLAERLPQAVMLIALLSPVSRAARTRSAIPTGSGDHSRAKGPAECAGNPSRKCGR